MPTAKTVKATAATFLHNILLNTRFSQQSLCLPVPKTSRKRVEGAKLSLR